MEPGLLNYSQGPTVGQALLNENEQCYNFTFSLLPSFTFFAHFLKFESISPEVSFIAFLFPLSFSASCSFCFLTMNALPVCWILSSCTSLFGILFLCGSRWAGESRFCCFSTSLLNFLFMPLAHLPL